MARSRGRRPGAFGRLMVMMLGASCLLAFGAGNASATGSDVLFDVGIYKVCVAEQVDNHVWCAGGFGVTEPERIGIAGIPKTGRITSIAAGVTWGCVTVDGEVYCWARHPSYGEEGIAEKVPGIDNAVKVDTNGNYVACGLLADGTVKCWNNNQQGGLGNGLVSVDGTLYPPTQVLGLSDATSLAVGHIASCAGKSDGTVWCWGSDRNDPLGLGAARSEPLFHTSAARVGGEAANWGGVSSVDGEGNFCAALRNGKAACWPGRAGYSNGYRNNGFPVITGSIFEIPNVENVKAVGGGGAGELGCALSESGVVSCWGWNEAGQAGNPEIAKWVNPAPVAGLGRVSAISTNYVNACARDNRGIWCWGSNNEGQLGPEAEGLEFSADPILLKPWEADEVDGVIPTEGPFTEISTTKDLRCGRNTKVGVTLPFPFPDLALGTPVFLTPDSCGTWVHVGGELVGPEPGRMQPAWPGSTRAWEPMTQTESGDGSASDPWEIKTRVTDGVVIVEQTDRYVDGASHTSTDIEVTNIVPREQHVEVYAAGDCIHRDVSGAYDTMGFGFRPIVADGTSGCSEKEYSGTTLSWGSEHPRARTTANTLGEISDQISSGGGFDLDCGCDSGIDDAAGVSWSSDLAPGESETFSYELAVGTGNPPGDGPWNMRAIRAAAAWDAPTPLTGAGQNVAIVDTGVDPDAPWFGDGPSGKIPAQACWSSEITAPYRIGPITTRKPSLLEGTCFRDGKAIIPEWMKALFGVGGVQTTDGKLEGWTGAGHSGGADTARPKADPCLSYPAVPCRLNEIDWGIGDRFFQGTFVAGLAAGENPDGVGGVAPKAKIVAANVSSWQLGPWRGTPKASTVGSSVIASPNDAAKALTWVDGLRSKRKIAAVNLMLPKRLDGTGPFASGTCEGHSPNLELAIKTLISHNISVVVAAGDDGNKSALAWPACLPGVISVGATDQRDRVWANSNSSAQLTLLAPGVHVESALVKSDDLTDRSGTFAAAAHVTGAIALYKQKYPNATVNQVRNALTGGSDQPTITDSNGITTPFLRVDEMLTKAE